MPEMKLPNQKEIALATLKSLTEFIAMKHSDSASVTEIYTHAFLAGASWGGLVAVDYLNSAVASVVKSPNQTIN